MNIINGIIINIVLLSQESLSALMLSSEFWNFSSCLSWNSFLLVFWGTGHQLHELSVVQELKQEQISWKMKAVVRIRLPKDIWVGATSG